MMPGGRPKKTVVETCSEIGCDKAVKGLGVCALHYARIYYLRRRKSGICGRCNEAADLPYVATCEACADKRRRAGRLKYAEGRI